MASEKKVRSAVAEVLEPGETVTASLRVAEQISNSSASNPVGVLALTSSHLLFSGTVRRTSKLESHLVSDVISIEFERGLIASFVRVSLRGPANAELEPTHTTTTYRADPSHGEAFVTAVRNAIDAFASAPAATPASETVDQLARLAALHDSGSLTDAEFAAAKAQVLGLPTE